jgi:hypothetical protein
MPKTFITKTILIRLFPLESSLFSVVQYYLCLSLTSANQRVGHWKKLAEHRFATNLMNRSTCCCNARDDDDDKDNNKDTTPVIL